MGTFLPIVRSATLAGFPDLARELGLDAPALLQQAGLHPRSLLDPETPLAVDAVGRLLEVSAQASGRTDFGLRLAQRRSFDALGPISLLLKGQPSVGEALETLLRYLRLVNPSLITNVVSRGQTVVVQEDLRREGAEASPQSIELTVGVMHRILQELLGPRWRPVSVHFRHASPRDASAHAAFFGCRVLFRAGYNGVALRPSDLAARPQGGDPGLAHLVRSVLDGALDSQHGADVVVRQLVVALLPGGGCTAQMVARHLGVDRRTLYRYLQVHDQTFSGVMQSVRRHLVQVHLAQGNLPLSESAALLGFASQSAFAYWFRTQFGCSVTRWRRLGQGGPGPASHGAGASAGAPVRTGRRTSG